MRSEPGEPRAALEEDQEPPPAASAIADEARD